MFEAGDYRSLVTATQQTLSEAFAFTEDFRQVKNCHAHAESQHSGGVQLVQTAGILTSLAKSTILSRLTSTCRGACSTCFDT